MFPPPQVKANKANRSHWPRSPSTSALYLQIKFTFDGANERSETLNFKRRKVCLASPPQSTLGKGAEEEEPKEKHDDDGDENKNGKDEDDDDGGDEGRSRLDPSSTTIVALGAAAGTIALLFILLTVI